jgi:hypothetical protein
MHYTAMTNPSTDMGSAGGPAEWRGALQIGQSGTALCRWQAHRTYAYPLPAEPVDKGRTAMPRTGRPIVVGVGIITHFAYSLPYTTPYTVRQISVTRQCSYQSSAEARRAPCTRDCSLAQAILPSTLRPQAEVPKPQSVPAMTRSRPTTSA